VGSHRRIFIWSYSRTTDASAPRCDPVLRLRGDAKRVSRLADNSSGTSITKNRWTQFGP
jgi:hypothetical protein